MNNLKLIIKNKNKILLTVLKPPVPLQLFSEPVLDCSKERDVCLHRSPRNSSLLGSENCLYLNIYTPILDEKSSPLKKLPVILFFHGGGFQTGSGNSDFYSPEYLVQEGVIVVTCNYRQGPLGFLYLPDGGVPGNAGLFDQRLALQWINENISNFNGDPDNVTLFGQSAGATSTNIHLLSYDSRFVSYSYIYFICLINFYLFAENIFIKSFVIAVVQSMIGLFKLNQLLKQGS